MDCLTSGLHIGISGVHSKVSSVQRDFHSYLPHHWFPLQYTTSSKSRGLLFL